jgi:CDGSH-type Zn-finger protein
MKELNKTDLNKIKSKVKGRPLYYCKCGLSKRYPYCDGRHGCDEPVKGNAGTDNDNIENSGSE